MTFEAADVIVAAVRVVTSMILFLGCVALLYVWLRVCGYRIIKEDERMTFGDALQWLKAGAAVARKGWNGKGMWLRLQRPDAHSKMTLPYIFIEYPEGHVAYPHGSRVPWLASQTDMLAEDWEVVSGAVDVAA